MTRGVRVRLAGLLRRLAFRLDQNPAEHKEPESREDIYNVFAKFAKKLFRRMMIWSVSLAVAFYVPISEAGIPYPLAEWEERITLAGKFPDVFLATVAMVVLSGSDLVDNVIARKSHNIGAVNSGSAWIFMAIYMLFIMYGMPAYSSATALATQSYLPWNVLLGLVGGRSCRRASDCNPPRLVHMFV